MSDFSGFHKDSDRTVPFPVNNRGEVPLAWLAQESYDPAAVLALYNEGLMLTLPAKTVDGVLLSKDEAWNLLDEMIIRHLAKPTHRFEEPPKEDSPTQQDDSDSWVTFQWD